MAIKKYPKKVLSSPKALIPNAKDKTLIIVESPTKAKTISGYLSSKSYAVVASNGHIIDLPKSRLAVDVTSNFEPEYITVRGRGPIMEMLRKLSKQAKQVFLASDNDREGEAISYHLASVVRKAAPEIPIYRIIFTEITKDAILQALKDKKEIDQRRVDAQKARRILDRLWGYSLSPFLWKKLGRRRLSGGRVQSVALRAICEREDEILNFSPEEHWSALATFKKDKLPSFEASVTHLGEKPFRPKSQKEIENDETRLKKPIHKVTIVTPGSRKRFPPKPLTTSSLQQEASHRLAFNAQRTMKIAQQLYEGIRLSKGQAGMITYMRTDSVRISTDAINRVRSLITNRYGEQWLPPQPRFYKNKKGAQDAHECIRPSDVQKDPSTVSLYLSSEQLKLYTLIWSHFVACQMEAANYETLAITVENEDARFRANHSTLVFPGWLSVLQEKEKKAKKPKELPRLESGDILDLKKIENTQHFTEAPPRYNDASLVRFLEESQIGRPSTYAAVLGTLQKRHYAKKEQRVFAPTRLGTVTNQLLCEHFPKLINVHFTSSLEEELDIVEEKGTPWVDVVRNFYTPFEKNLNTAMETAQQSHGLLDEKTDLTCEECQSPMVKRLGRNGFFLACTAFPKCTNSRSFPLGLCAQCGKGSIIERKGGRGKRTFYGCTAYPECKFTSWERPFEEKSCTLCERIVVLRKDPKKGALYLCLNPECGHSESAATKKASIKITTSSPALP